MLTIFTLSFPKVIWRWARGWERSQAGQLTWTGQSYILYHITSCSAIKSGVVEEERKFSASRVAIAWSLAGYCLWDVISHCFYITFFFFSPLHLFSLPWPKSLIAFAVPIFSSVPWEWELEKQLCGCLTAGWGQTSIPCHHMLIEWGGIICASGYCWWAPFVQGILLL